MQRQKIIFLILLKLGIHNFALCQEIKCLADTNSIVNGQAISIDLDKSVAAISHAKRIKFYQNTNKNQLKMVVESPKAQTIFNFHYELRQPDEYYNSECYLFVEQIVSKARQDNSLEGFSFIKTLPDSVLQKIQEEKYDREFNEVLNIWDIRDKKIPCRIWIEFVDSWPHWSKKALSYDMIFYSCFPVKINL